MTTNCLTCDPQSQTSSTFQDRGEKIGKTFIYTVLVFLALCLVSYVVHA